MSEFEAVSRGSTGASSRSEGSAADSRRRSDAILDLLQEVAIKLNETPTVEEALAFVLDRICGFTGWTVGHAFLLAPGPERQLVSSGVFHLERGEEFDAFHSATLDAAFRPQEGLPGQVFDAGQPRWIGVEDIEFARASAVDDLNVVTGFACPIFSRDGVVGVLEFFSRTRSEPDEEFVSVASNIGAQLGRVIERAQAAEAIRESEERLRALTGVAVESIITVDAEGRVVDWNPAATATFGYTPEEALGDRVDVILPDRLVRSDRVGIDRYAAVFDRSAIGTTVESVGRRSDGTEFPADVSVTAWTAKGERFYTAIVRDVSERHRAQEAVRQSQKRLREREEQLERAQRIAHLGSWHWNVTTNELSWSDELYRIYGLDPSEPVTYERYHSLHHAEDSARSSEIVRGSLETGRPFSFYHRIRRADTGEIRILHGEGDVQVDADGRVIKLFGTAQDVTELRRAEEGLRESERKFRLVAENMTDLILLQDAQGDLVYVSPSAKRILGYEAGELLGRSFYDLLVDDDAERLRDGAHGDPVDGESYTQALVRARTRDGSIVWLELAGKPIPEADAGGERLLASGRDVTERVLAEEEARKYRRELEKRNRELQDFAYVASHDLQEPLRKIHAFADLIDDDYGEALGEEGKVFLDRVRHAAARMSALINDLLQFSRVTTKGGSFEKTDLNEIVAGVLTDLEIAVGESDAHIEVADLPLIVADPLQMRQLFQNLIGNAIKFGKPDEPPHITVTADVVRQALPSGALRVDLCRIRVTDNGVGFDSKYADRIFTPFQRLHNRKNVEGTGMGLAICRRIIERHDGRISVSSEAGAGAVFTVELPMKQEKENGT